MLIKHFWKYTLTILSMPLMPRSTTVSTSVGAVCNRDLPAWVAVKNRSHRSFIAIPFLETKGFNACGVVSC